MITRKLFFRFPKSETEKPIVYHLVKDHNLIINIFRAKVTAEDEGYLVLDVTGKEEDIERGLDFRKTAVGEVMSRDPWRVDENELGVQALRIMEERAITSLAVTDPEGRLQGLVHLHDLLRAGIA